MKKLTIIGGTSGFGKWLALFCKRKFGNLEIVVTGSNEKKGKKLEKETNLRFSKESKKEVKNSDFVVFSVPIAKTENLIKKIGPKIKKWAVVLDVTSVKSFPSESMKKFCNQCTVIPTHPIFGPFVREISGQVVVLTPEGKTKKEKSYKFLKKFLEKEGAKVIETNPEKHDKMMAVIQGLTHYSLFVIGATMKKLELDLDFSEKLVSPIYKILTSSVARYLGQDAKLYGDIQMYNDENLKVHKGFMEVSEEFHKFVKEKDEKSFIKKIEETRDFFGTACTEGQNYTDKITFLLSDQIKKIKEKIGEEVAFKNIYTEEKVNVKIKKLEQEKNEILLENGEVLNLNTWVIQ